MRIFILTVVGGITAALLVFCGLVIKAGRAMRELDDDE